MSFPKEIELIPANRLFFKIVSDFEKMLADLRFD